VMVPRTDVVFIERTKTIRQAMSLALRSGYSRIPVIGESLDDIVGFAYLKDLTKRVFDRHEAETTERVDSVMRPALYVPDSKPIDALLREMQAERKHVGVVVDEYGGTAGVVTLEDVVEEIVGEVSDEHDRTRSGVVRLRDGTYVVPGLMRPDEVRARADLAVPDGPAFETVGGYVMAVLGRVPKVGDEVPIRGAVLRVERMDGRRVERLRALPRPESVQEEKP
jgi:CBS domain containing-hemolysin-like protein